MCSCSQPHRRHRPYPPPPPLLPPPPPPPRSTPSPPLRASHPPRAWPSQQGSQRGSSPGRREGASSCATSGCATDLTSRPCCAGSTSTSPPAPSWPCADAPDAARPRYCARWCAHVASPSVAALSTGILTMAAARLSYCPLTSAAPLTSGAPLPDRRGRDAHRRAGHLRRAAARGARGRAARRAGEQPHPHGYTHRGCTTC